MHRYVDSLRALDERREGLDFEIQDLLAELNTEDYENLDPAEAQVADLPQDGLLKRLVDKLVERQQELEAQRAELERIYEEEQKNVSYQAQQLQGLQDAVMETYEEFGQAANQ